MLTFRSFVSVDDVETQSFDWGQLQWLSEPRVTGSTCMTTGIVTLAPGKGHERHNHPGSEENLFVLEGTGRQMIETKDGPITQTIQVGDLIHLEAGQYHSTMNTGATDMRLLAMYEYAGPEEALRNDPGCTLLPPKNI